MQLCISQPLLFPGKPHNHLCSGGDIQTCPDLLPFFARRLLMRQRAKESRGPPQKALEYTGQGPESNRLSPRLRFLVRMDRRTDTYHALQRMCSTTSPVGGSDAGVLHRASPFRPSHPAWPVLSEVETYLFQRTNFKTLPFSNLGLLLLACCFNYLCAFFFCVPSGTDTVERAKKLNCAGLPPALIDTDSYSHRDFKKKKLKNHWDLSLLRNLYSIKSGIRHNAKQKKEKLTPVGS